MNEAGEVFQKMINTVGEDIYMRGPITTWFSGKVYLLIYYASEILSKTFCNDYSPPPSPPCRF